MVREFLDSERTSSTSAKVVPSPYLTHIITLRRFESTKLYSTTCCFSTRLRNVGAVCLHVSFFVCGNLYRGNFKFVLRCNGQFFWTRGLDYINRPKHLQITATTQRVPSQSMTAKEFSCPIQHRSKDSLVTTRSACRLWVQREGPWHWQDEPRLQGL